MPKDNPPAVKREILAIIHAAKGETSVARSDEMDLIEELKKIKSAKDETQIDLLLNSPGGDIHAAYKMVCLLRAKCKTFNIIVPYYAKSAATLMCLGSDKIFMAQPAELGPLDAQIEHPLMEGTQLSALDGVSPLDFFSDMCEYLTVHLMGASIRLEVGLSRKESVEMALEFSHEFVKPVVGKLDPLLVNMCFRSLQVAERYGKELLTKYMLNGDRHADDIAEATTRELVWEYPEHGYAICIDEARRLKLKVSEAESLAEWDKLWDYYKEKERDGGTHIHLITEQILGRKSA